MNSREYVNDIVAEFVQGLQDNLVGVYLHGSLAMGCFNPNTSDIDIIVVVKKPINDSLRKNMIQNLLEITKDKSNKLEMSIILERYAKSFIYPTPFELHFFHPRYLEDKNYICGGEGFTDLDLAGHMTVLYRRGKTLYGEKFKKVFKPIASKYYLASIMNDINNAKNEIVSNPIYFTLNLCRVFCYVKTKNIVSKREGGEWGKIYAPKQYKRIITQCLEAYNGSNTQIQFDKKQLENFASYMLKEIRNEINYSFENEDNND